MEEHADRVAEVTDDEYVAVTEDTFVGIAIQRFREFQPEDDETTVYYLYVVDHEDRLVGVMSFRELLNAPQDDLVADHMVPDTITIEVGADPEEAAHEISEMDYPALPVVDEDGHLVGILRTEDLIDVVEEEATEDILKGAGFSFADVEASRSEAILESGIPTILKLRLPWLAVALGGGLLAGTVIEAFESTLNAVIALAFFLPVIMAMGGNVGTQASTIFVRGIATGHITNRNALKHFAREAVVGLLIGAAVGSVGAGAAYLWQGSTPYAAELAAVVFFGLVSVCLVAALNGYLIPWIMLQLDFDPAAASNPLITTVQDVVALFIYFALAAVLLSGAL